MSDDTAREVTPCATCGGTQIDPRFGVDTLTRGDGKTLHDERVPCPDCGEVETPEAARQDAIERLAKDDYAHRGAHPLVGWEAIPEWARAVHRDHADQQLASIEAAGWTPPGGTE